MSGHNDADLNENAIRDGVELWVNSITHVGGLTVAPWLTVSDAGVLAPGAAQEVVVSVDASGLAPGSYTGSVGVVTDAARAGQVTVPVSVTVTPDSTGPDVSVVSDASVREVLTRDANALIADLRDT